MRRSREGGSASGQGWTDCWDGLLEVLPVRSQRPMFFAMIIFMTSLVPP
ncbi:predicted protein [Streptomyces albidoflavus]|nr:predicted protein [Streptomyces albidoflavus]